MSSESHRDELGRALGRIASGVYVVTAKHDGNRHGLLATWIAQSSFSPPLVTVAVNKERPMLKLIDTEGSLFTINILAKTNMDVFKAFARPHVEDEVRFSGLSLHSDTEHGVIFADVASALSCKTVRSVEAGDHVLVVAEVTSGCMFAAEEVEPMIHLRNNGFKY